MNEGVEAAFNLMKDRIRSTHLHDNNGKDDSHLFPFLSEGGTIDWKQTMELLRSRGDQYPLLLELKEKPEISNSASTGTVKQIFDKLESAVGRSGRLHRLGGRDKIMIPELRSLRPASMPARPWKSPAGFTTCANPGKIVFPIAARRLRH